MSTASSLSFYVCPWLNVSLAHTLPVPLIMSIWALLPSQRDDPKKGKKRLIWPLVWTPAARRLWTCARLVCAGVHVCVSVCVCACVCEGEKEGERKCHVRQPKLQIIAAPLEHPSSSFSQPQQHLHILRLSTSPCPTIYLYPTPPYLLLLAKITCKSLSI